MGPRHFYVTIYDQAVREGAIMAGRSDDPSGAVSHKLHMLCGF